jgi:ADP-ribose pyrophosphatase YjhB (NUDIX family)
MNNSIRVRACALIIENDSILLIEFHDENGFHYNLPAGGVELGESVIDAVKREAREEAGVEVEVGPLALVHESIDDQNIFPHQLSLMFDCKIKPGSITKFPENPDLNQTDVKWIPISQLNEILLIPDIKNQIVEYTKKKRNINLIQDIKHKMT